MGKLVRILALLALVAIIATGFIQWNAYQTKKELRADALLYFKEEDYTKTIGYLEKALKVKCLFGGNIDRDMQCYLAESYLDMDDYEKAEQIYQKLQKKEPSNALYYLQEGVCSKASGDYEQAMEIFQKGWEKTRDPAFLSRICEIYIEQKEYDKALDYARQGMNGGDTAGAELMYELIIIYEKSEDYDKAYEAAKEYCDLYPDDERARKELIFLSSRI